ncbi:HK97-gp10 family putative phage morphogenesis protein [Leuconostoc fallax]|uniref:HK97-gp10 family putative phage morphogenesis protein n=1 Tax=Leuconostoc fallax TaxID=1251 RepID=UPI001C1EBCE7|nr:HK97-gp10 family putative phage morphogenesis protein [Leuconostoc fallax]MBU7455844.1 HK97 gp10 family phage protein [Leuconostoc fallax]
MARVTIDFKGADKLISKFQSQPAKVQREAGNIILNTAQRVQTRAIKGAPVDTGYLKQHVQAKKSGNLSADVVSMAEYSIYQEFGTRKMAAHPYMRPAMKQESPFLFEKLENLLQKGLL